MNKKASGKNERSRGFTNRSADKGINLANKFTRKGTKAKLRILAAMAFCLIVAAAGCGKDSPAVPESQNQEEALTSGTPATRSADPETDASFMEFQKPFHMSQEDTFNRGCASEKGYYFMGNGYLYFVDKETMQSTILCGKPECSHQDQNCNAYLGNISHITYYDGKLYYAAGQEQGIPGVDEGVWNLYTMNADGTRKTNVMTLRAQNEGFYSMPTQFVIHKGQVLFLSDRENILCVPLGGELKDAKVVKTNDMKLDDEAVSDSLELWYLWADQDKFYCFGNPKSKQFRDTLYEYDPGTEALTEVWKVPESAETGKWDTSDVSVNGWYIDQGILYYFLSGNGLYQYNLSTKETQKIAATDDPSHTGTAEFDGEMAYINNRDKDTIYVYTRKGEYLGEYGYREYASLGNGQEEGSGIGRIIGSDADLVFLCVENLMSMTQDGFGMGYMYYYLPKSEIRSGKGEFKPLAFP